MEEPTNFNTVPHNVPTNPTKKKAGRKPKIVHNDSDIKDDIDKNRKLKLYSELSKIYEDYKNYLSDYKIPVGMDSTEEEMHQCKQEMMNIIVTKESVKLPNVFTLGLQIFYVLKEFGVVKDELYLKLERFRKAITDNYSYIEPEIKAIMVKWPVLVKITSGFPVELMLLLKLQTIWREMSNPIKDMKETKIPKKYDDM